MATNWNASQAKAQVNAAIALKANITDVTTGLADKADVSALALKANITDVTTGLAAKADVSALATKADVSALALKANITDVLTGLAGKSDTGHSHAFSELTAKPTTLAGYGITDAARLVPSIHPVAGEFAPTTTFAMSAAIGNQAGTANALDLFQWCPSADIAGAFLQIRVNTAVASALVKIVVYDSDEYGKPRNLLFESGDLDCSAVSLQSAPFVYTFKAGTKYWVGVRHSSTAAINAWNASAIPDILVSGISTSSRKMLRRSVSYATAAPATWTWSPSDLSALSPCAIMIGV